MSFLSYINESRISIGIMLSFISLFLMAVLYWIHWKVFRYWMNRDVEYIEPTWFFGSVKDEMLGRKTWRSYVEKCYKKFKDKGFGGYYLLFKPGLCICDPNLIEKILVQDFTYFHDRMPVGNHEMFLKNLANETGDKWRIMRCKLGQAFTSKKIKGMYDQIFRSGDYVLNQIDNIVNNNEPVELEPMILVFVTEALTSCTFGLQLTSDSHQLECLNEILAMMHENSPSRYIFIVLSQTYPGLFSFLKLRILSNKMAKFFRDLTRGAIRFRNSNKIKRNDFLQMTLLLKEQEETGALYNPPDLNEEDRVFNQVRDVLPKRIPELSERIFTEDCIAALMMNFVYAGVKPSVVTISFALYEIARNPRIQNTLHQEIDLVVSKHKGWSYEAIGDMNYLDSVIQETLRRWNFNLVLIRKVTEDYKMPETNITLEKGTFIHILMSALFMDPQYFPDPEEFIPERFPDNSYKPTSTFMPFGQGPRICIGIRLAVTMMKVCIARILSEYRLGLSDKMTQPPPLDPTVYYPKVVGGTWLSFTKR